MWPNAPVNESRALIPRVIVVGRITMQHIVMETFREGKENLRMDLLCVRAGVLSPISSPGRTSPLWTLEASTDPHSLDIYAGDREFK